MLTREACDWILEVDNKEMRELILVMIVQKHFAELTKNINSESRNHNKFFTG